MERLQKLQEPHLSWAGMSIPHVDAESWQKEVDSAEGLVLVEFVTPTCPWCKHLEPVIQELFKLYGDRVKFLQIDAPANREIADRYGIMGTPTLKFMCSGRPVGEIIGYLPRNQIAAKIEDALDSYRVCLEKSTPVAAR